LPLSALIGLATVLSGIGADGRLGLPDLCAALHPSIAELQVAIVAVRFFGIARGLFRYLERTTSHQATFRLLSRLRVWFYAALEPLAPARLLLRLSQRRPALAHAGGYRVTGKTFMCASSLLPW